LNKSRRKAAFAVADAAPKKCCGEPLRQQMGFDESLPARKSRVEHDPGKLQTFRTRSCAKSKALER
jgi:hypothetical protein